MKRLVLSSLMLVALGAGSVLAAQNANKAKPAAKPAAAKKSANAGGGAAADTGGTMKSSGKKHHRKHRKHQIVDRSSNRVSARKVLTNGLPTKPEHARQMPAVRFGCPIHR